MDGLGDGSEARHADTQGPARHPKRGGMGHRSEYTDAHPIPARRGRRHLLDRRPRPPADSRGCPTSRRPRRPSPATGRSGGARGSSTRSIRAATATRTGTAIGDLPGIIEHLDHLGPDGLGVDGVWLSPIYPSPGFDVGYDVSDHAAVDPLLGTEDDFDRLVREAHARGLRVILDLVMNHTSDQHAWFQASRQSREGPYADFYLWRDPAGRDADGNPLPPNNWLSFFGGSAWQYEPARDQFYMHTFLVEQPEVNWRNPAVEEAQLKMVRGWLDRGVDGFRLDVFNIFLKDPEMPSNPELAEVADGTSAWDRQEHKYDRDQPDFPELIARFRAIVDEVPGRMSVGELFYGGPETSASLSNQNHLVFDWELVRAPWSAAEYRALLDRRQAIFGDTWPTVVLSNHDQSRHASRLSASAGIDDTDAVARASAAVLLTLRGTPFLYYGEEIGLRDVEVPFDEIIDPPARRVEEGWVWWNRDGCRSPMPWTGRARSRVHHRPSVDPLR